MEEQTELQAEVRDGVLWLRMNRPEALNALTATLVVNLAAELERVVGRDDVRVVVLTGAGGAFSAGADIAGPDAATRFDVGSMDDANRLVRAVVACDRPVVAAVAGIAAGVACSMALACDLVVAGESAAFLLPFTRIGLMPDGGSSALAAASIGRARAMRMALLAEPLTGAEGFARGLVSHLVADADLPGEVERITRRLAAGPPLSLAATKRAVNAATLGHLDAALERERTGQTILFGTADFAEGLAAFGERRRPTFGGD